jgi:hypothetical protein
VNHTAQASLVIRRPWLVTAIVFVVVWGLITHGTFAGSGDEPHYLMIAHSIAFDGDVDLANNYAQPGNLVGSGTLRPEAHARPGKDGVLRPVHDVGMPLLFAPYVRLAYPIAEAAGRSIPEPWLRRARLNPPLILRHLISLVMALVTGLLAAQLFALFLETSGAPRASFGWACLLALSPPLLSHSFLFFTEIPSALLCLWVLRRIVSRADVTPPWELVGLATGLLLFVHVRNIALVVALSVVAAMRVRGTPGDGLRFAAGLLAPVAVRAAFNYRLRQGYGETSPKLEERRRVKARPT